MAESRFLYVTYIRAPAQKVCDALIDPEQNKLFWSGYHQQTSWKVGDDYAIVGTDGQGLGHRQGAGVRAAASASRSPGCTSTTRR